MDSLDPQVSYELSKLDPDVPFRATKAHLHHTWAKTFYSQPELYIQPESVAEIQKVVNLARKCRRRLVTVGSGHSPSDLTCTSSWIVNLDNFRRILSFSRETGVVTVESGIRLWQLGDELEKCGLMLPNLGSIDSQSIAGVISTGTHGSSLRFGLLSDSVQALSIALANGQVVRCSKTNNPSLFRAALLSLGALGIITEITIQAVPTFNIAWKQTLKSLPQVLENGTLGYGRARNTFGFGGCLILSVLSFGAPTKPICHFGNHVQLSMVADWAMQFITICCTCPITFQEYYPGSNGSFSACNMASNLENTWQKRLNLAELGPQAISRLSAWLNGDAKAANIPFSHKGLWVHCPIEVRVSDTSKSETPRPYLEQTNKTGPTLYLNATLYRPHLRDPPCTARYYEAFEWLMRDLGGRPHWAKNFGENLGPADFQEMYGADLNEWLRVRNEADPHGMFLGEWHRRTLLPAQHAVSNSSEFPLAEREKSRRKIGKWGSGDGVEWVGDKSWSHPNAQLDKPGEGEKFEAASPSPLATATSEESFDYLAHGEASIMGSSNPNGQDSSNF
ncbi:D-arabinono-1,4-lactone oxidase [Coccidioides immitis RMSCC 3703]|uniref:D-arabinono-1,4-lactone oxidase n=1 Tax=Coccidioides immitis RMSCC 3703 TaxID=454286 RepID=A0A0J8TEU7_COCIT|nr:D-arabinono-1,4-lactone oxidase [Coccidioides immitis RMSCC 3703]